MSHGRGTQAKIAFGRPRACLLLNEFNVAIGLAEISLAEQSERVAKQACVYLALGLLTLEIERSSKLAR